MSHEMGQFVVKIAHLAILMEPKLLLEKVACEQALCLSVSLSVHRLWRKYQVTVSYPDYGFC